MTTASTGTARRTGTTSRASPVRPAASGRARTGRHRRRAAGGGQRVFAAARAGDLTALVELLDPGIVLRTDGFADTPAVLRGAATVAGAAVGGASTHAEFRPVLVNGAAGMLITLRGRPAGPMAFTIVGGLITAVDGITDPDRLRRLAG